MIPKNTYLTKLAIKFLSGTNCLWMSLPGDERRAEETIQALAQKVTELHKGARKFELWIWNVASGLSAVTEKGERQPLQPELRDPVQLLNFLSTAEGNALVILHDMHLLLNAPTAVTLRRTFIELCKLNAFNTAEHAHVPVILADTGAPHGDIKEYVSSVTFDLPDKQSMLELAATLYQQVTKKDPAECVEQLDVVADALLGLSYQEAERILAESLSACSGFNDAILDWISTEKEQAFRKVPGLEFVPRNKIRAADTLGGYDKLIEFLQTRRHAYSSQANKMKIPRPRGISLLGPPGTGKTSMAKIAARVLGLDLVVMNVSQMFDGVVGNSEKRMATAMAMLKPMQRCVLMLDEVDKVFAGAHQTQKNDGGVNARLFKELLDFMADRDMRFSDDNQAFVVLTMNRVEGLPPELLRAGRLDALFFTALPNPAAREDILRIQLRNYGLDSVKYSLSTLAGTLTEQFSGAELEAVVVNAVTSAFARAANLAELNGTEIDAQAAVPTMDDLILASKAVTPMAKVNPEEVRAITDYCTQMRAQNVSNEELTTKPRLRQVRTGLN